VHVAETREAVRIYNDLARRTLVPGRSTPPADFPSASARMRAVFAEPAPLLAGAAAVGDPVAVLPVLFGMLWRGALAADLDRCRLASATLVHARGVGRADSWPGLRL
jgi:hypothetical protein